VLFPISTTPYLPKSEVATNYLGLTFMTIISDAIHFRYCEWHHVGFGFLHHIFSSSDSSIHCNTYSFLFETTCSYDLNNTITTSFGYLSPLTVNQAGIYFVRCVTNYAGITVAETSIDVTGKRLQVK